MYYDAKTKKVSTIDGRETAPKSFTPTVFQSPDGKALPSPGGGRLGPLRRHPGHARAVGQGRCTRDLALGELLKPAQKLAEKGFVVDQTFRDQTAANADRFRKFPATAAVFLPGNKPPVVGSTFTNPDMAKAYRELRPTASLALRRRAGRGGRGGPTPRPPPATASTRVS